MWLQLTCQHVTVPFYYYCYLFWVWVFIFYQPWTFIFLFFLLWVSSHHLSAYCNKIRRMKKMERERLNWNKKTEESDDRKGEGQTKGILTPTYQHTAWEIFLYLNNTAGNVIYSSSGSFMTVSAAGEVRGREEREGRVQPGNGGINATLQKWMEQRKKIDLERGAWCGLERKAGGGVRSRLTWEEWLWQEWRGRGGGGGNDVLRRGEAGSSCDPEAAERKWGGVSGGVEMSSASPRRRRHGDKCPLCSFS